MEHDDHRNDGPHGSGNPLPPRVYPHTLSFAPDRVPPIEERKVRRERGFASTPHPVEPECRYSKVGAKSLRGNSDTVARSSEKGVCGATTGVEMRLSKRRK